MSKPKPHIYWTYYPKSSRGYWRVSPKPKWRWQAEWRKAHQIVTRMNEQVSRLIEYKREYAKQLEIRKTT